MKHYKVTFQYNEDRYCSNIAQAETEEDVRAHYEQKYPWCTVEEATESDVDLAKRKGMPVIMC